MRIVIIVASIFSFWLGARIADDPLVGIVVAAVVATVLTFGRRTLRRRNHIKPPNRS